jgi:hypothetical protein
MTDLPIHRLSVANRAPSLAKKNLLTKFKKKNPKLMSSPKTPPPDHACVDENTEKHFKAVNKCRAWTPGKDSPAGDVVILYPPSLLETYGVCQVSDPEKAHQQLGDQVEPGTIEYVAASQSTWT